MDPTRLDALRDARELLITARRRDGRLPDPVRIWVVVVDDEVLVRTWRPRDTGWYGGARRTGQARVEVLGEAVDVTVEARPDVAADAVDEGYRAKYGREAARSMTTPDAVRSTLRLGPAT